MLRQVLRDSRSDPGSSRPALSFLGPRRTSNRILMDSFPGAAPCPNANSGQSEGTSSSGPSRVPLCPPAGVTATSLPGWTSVSCSFSPILPLQFVPCGLEDDCGVYRA